MDCVSAVSVEEVARVVRAHSFRYWSEALLQDAVAEALESCGLTVEREVRLNRHDRADLLVERVCAEIKVAGTLPSVARQIERYLRSERLDGLVLVTTRVRHLGLPPFVRGKPVEVVTLAGGGL